MSTMYGKTVRVVGDSWLAGEVGTVIDDTDPMLAELAGMAQVYFESQIPKAWWVLKTMLEIVEEDEHA